MNEGMLEPEKNQVAERVALSRINHVEPDYHPLLMYGSMLPKGFLLVVSIAWPVLFPRSLIPAFNSRCNLAIETPNSFGAWFALLYILSLTLEVAFFRPFQPLRRLR